MFWEITPVLLSPSPIPAPFLVQVQVVTNNYLEFTNSEVLANSARHKHFILTIFLAHFFPQCNHIFLCICLCSLFPPLKCALSTSCPFKSSPSFKVQLISHLLHEALQWPPTPRQKASFSMFHT